MKKKTIGIVVCTFVMVLAILIMGPMDMFSHGYYCDEIDNSQITEEDVTDYIRLDAGDFEMKFVPQKKHLVGFEIYLVNQPEDNTGTLILTVLQENGKQIDRIETDLSEIPVEEWYKLYSDASFKKDEVYTLRISAENCTTCPWLQAVDSDYLPKETVSGNILMGYAYASSTFTFQNKVLIGLFIVVIWGIVCTYFLENVKIKKNAKGVIAFALLTGVLSWNYMYNSMDNQNTRFSDFQRNSDALVTGAIRARQDNIDLSKVKYGLGFYHYILGIQNHTDPVEVSDDLWVRGYSKEEAAILIDLNMYTDWAAVQGNYAMFANGDIFRIIDVTYMGDYKLKVTFDVDRILNSEKYGSLEEIVFLDAAKSKLDKGRLVTYESQYGLQGKVFGRMARAMNFCEDTVLNLHLLCSMALAVVLTAIIFIIAMKCNTVMAGVFYVTFWLSPYVVNFARNLYWVEFTWFLPMAIGLFCSWKIESRKCRMISYIMTFIAIFGKSLCGYEYISTIMLGLISFLIVDLVLYIIDKEKIKAYLLFRTVVIIGLVALAGFMGAICIHALLRGDGDVIYGIKNIIMQDVLRRTAGGNLNDFDEVYWTSFNASVWEVFCNYFHFDTEIITGIAGNLFPMLCVVPLCIFAYEYKKQELHIKHLVMYIVFFLTSISWFCLAKGHSHMHTFLNMVLWYFGFIQICFYVIVEKVINLVKKMKYIDR